MRQYRRPNQKLFYEPVKAALRLHGNNKMAVARAFGVSWGAINQYIRRHGLFVRFRLVTERERLEMRRLRKGGWSYHRIGHHMGYAGGTVRPYVMDIIIPARTPMHVIYAERFYRAYRHGATLRQIASIYRCGERTVMKSITWLRKTKGIVADKRSRT